MEVPIVLLCTLLTVCSLSITHGENDLRGNNGDSAANDMTLVESSPSRSNILVHNSFHLPPMDQTFHIPPMDQMRSPEMIEETQFTDSSTIRQPVKEHYNSRSDGMRMLEDKIDWLVKSNHEILSIVHALEYRMNQTLHDTINNFNIRSTKQPASTIDLMDNMEVRNLLSNIHQHIIASDSKAKQSAVLEADQIKVIKDFVAVIESERRNTGHVTQSTPNSVNQVLANSWKTIQYLEKVSGTVQDIDERTVRMFDKSCRQEQKLLCDNPYDDCKCENCNRRYENGRYERTYGSMKRDTNRVTFEPNKYSCHDLQIRKNGVYKLARSIDRMTTMTVHRRMETDGGLISTNANMEYGHKLNEFRFSCTQGADGDYMGLTWENWLGSNFLKSSEMMIRPKGLWGGKDSEEYIYTSNAVDS